MRFIKKVLKWTAISGGTLFVLFVGLVIYYIAMETPEEAAERDREVALLIAEKQYARRKQMKEEEARKAAEWKAEREKAREEAQFKCLSAWDGSFDELNRMVKRNLREPGSFEHIETKITPVDKNGHQVVFLRYRARNGFGGMNVESTQATINNADCTLLFGRPK